MLLIITVIHIVGATNCTQKSDGKYLKTTENEKVVNGKTAKTSISSSFTECALRALNDADTDLENFIEGTCIFVEVNEPPEYTPAPGWIVIDVRRTIDVCEKEEDAEVKKATTTKTPTTITKATGTTTGPTTTPPGTAAISITTNTNGTAITGITKFSGWPRLSDRVTYPCSMGEACGTGVKEFAGIHLMFSMQLVKRAVLVPEQVPMTGIKVIITGADGQEHRVFNLTQHGGNEIVLDKSLSKFEIRGVSGEWNTPAGKRLLFKNIWLFAD